MRKPTLMRFAVIAVAVAAALATWGIIRLAGIELALKDDAPSDSVGAVDVVVATVLAGLAAWAVHAAMLRLHWARLWPFAGSTALAISISGPSWFADGESAVALIVMHFVVAIVLITGYAMLAPVFCAPGDNESQREARMQYRREEAH